MPFLFPDHPFYLAVQLDRALPLRRARRLRRSLGILACASFTVFVASRAHSLFGLTLIFLAGYGALALWSAFVASFAGRGISRLSEAPSAAAESFAGAWPRHIDFAAAKFLSRVREPDEPRAVLDALLDSEFGDFFFARAGFSRRDFSAELERAYRSAPHHAVSLAEVARGAAAAAIRNRHAFITPADFLLALAALDGRFSQALVSHKLSAKDFDCLAHWLAIIAEHERPRGFVERLAASPGIGKTWAYGYTPWLDRASRPVRSVREDELHIIGHGREIAELGEALAKSSEANAFLVGEPGVGKTTVVKGLAKRIGEGRSAPELNYRRVRELAMEAVLAEKSLGGIEEALGRVFGEAERAGNVILVIRDLELYLVPGAATHLTEVLMPFFRSPAMKIVGLTTPEGYAKSMAQEPALAGLFTEVRVEEPGEEIVMEILADAAIAAERRYRRRMLFPALKQIYALSARYAAGEPFPEKGVTLLEEVFVYAREEARVREITPEIVERVLERRFGAAIGEVEERERKALSNLEALLHRRVVDQEEAIAAIADAIRRKRTGVAAGGKPVGSFLFLGPTGVGKTETAKALAEAYYGSEEAMIRLDMSEYKNSKDIGRLIGDPDTNAVGGLAAKVRERPFSLLLLDEIEKAHPNILNLFLQILDEGRATDAYGKRVDFTNAIIIGTSNAGSEFIRESLAAGMPYAELKRKLLDEVLRARIFQTEFVNRFDAAVVYAPLGKTHARQVAGLMLERLKKRLEPEGYRLAWPDEILDSLVAKGYSEIFGGRELRRLIQDEVESKIARDILAGKYKKGDAITVRPLE